MTTWPRIQFVSAPDASATVLCDLNEPPTRTQHDGFSLGMAALDGEAGSRSRSWGLRQGISIPLRVTAPRAEALAALRTIARHATQDGWLLVQPDAGSEPRWFRTYKSQPEPLEWGLVDNGPGPDRWGLTLPLVADAFGIGAPVELPATAVLNDPRSAGMEVVLPGIAGEMPAPAVVTYSSTSWMLGPAAGIVSAAVPLVAAGSWNTGALGATVDTAYLAGQRQETLAGSFSDWTRVASFNISDVVKGTFTPVLRVSASSTTGAWLLRWEIGPPSTQVPVPGAVMTDPTVVSCATQRRWITTGRVRLPLTNASVLGGSNATVLRLYAKRASSGGELRFDDRLLLIDAAEGASLLRTTADDLGAVPTMWRADAAERMVSMTGDGKVTRMPGFAGGWPVLYPGRTNRLVAFRNLDPTLVAGRDDSITSSTTVTVSYRPRYLWGV